MLTTDGFQVPEQNHMAASAEGHVDCRHQKLQAPAGVLLRGISDFCPGLYPMQS